MIKFIKNFFYVFLVLAISKNVYAFDLKSLTDKIQKDVGEKLKIPQTNSGSNLLGGMLKGPNQNKGSKMMTTTGLSTSGGNSNKKLAKGLCEPNIPQTIKNLPKANLALVENMQYKDGVKIGVLTGSLLSTLFGYFLILLTPNKPNK